MTPKQKRFCEEYLIDMNATQAAIRAGYSEISARSIAEKNMTKHDIKNYIDEELQKIKNKNIADAQEVMEHLTAAMRGQIKEEVVVVEGSGDGCSDARVMDKQLSAKDRIKAAELLGKRYKLFVDKVDITGSVPVKILDDIKDDEDESE